MLGCLPCLCALGSSVPCLSGTSRLPWAIPFLPSSSLQRRPPSALSPRGAWGGWTSHGDETWPGLVPVTPMRRSSRGSSRVLSEVADAPPHPLNRFFKVSFLTVAYLLPSCPSPHGWGWRRLLVPCTADEHPQKPQHQCWMQHSPCSREDFSPQDSSPR